MGTFPLLDYILNAVGVLAEGMHSRIRFVHVESQMIFIRLLYGGAIIM